MSRKYKKAVNQWAFWGPTLLLVLVSACFALCIYQYCNGAVGYDKLEQREYTFVKYEITSGKGGGAIKIYVEEEKLPLYGCPNFVRKAVNEDILDRAHKGDKLVVCVSPRSSSMTYCGDVHEGKINGKYFLRIEDYQKYHAKNDILGIVICSVLVAGGFVGIGIYLVVAKEK